MATVPPSITVPEGHTLHQENSAYIILPSGNGAFLNPIQEFNRDLSVACIRMWGERINKEKEAKWRRKAENKGANKSKKLKLDDAAKPEESLSVESKNEAIVVDAATEVPPTENAPEVNESASLKPTTHEYKPYKFTIIEPLSATGLRSIRYAKEIPLVKHVLANDLSPTAIEAMRRNVEINELGAPKSDVVSEPSDAATEQVPERPAEAISDKAALGKVRITEGDACALLYSHRAEKARMDVVDLDPYGTAAPFIDGAVQAVTEGGLLCVTCTDLAVLAGNNYPEKCFANYGGAPVKAEYCHEVALRLVIHSIATAAARYGRCVTPLLSLSIDFYVRVFVQVRTAAIEVKKLACTTAAYYVCTECQAFHEQPFGKVIERKNESSGNVNKLYRTTAGPPIGGQCEECSSRFHIAGPMWSGPLHDSAFATEVLDHVNTNSSNYGTAARMKGMLTVAAEELETPFYFTPSKVASFFHCTSPPLHDVGSALLNAGYKISRSHASAGSIKTNAGRDVVHDIFRAWMTKHPVTMSNIKDGSPARVLLAKEAKMEADFKHHPQSITNSVKLVRYQQNPAPNWGPQAKAGGGKRKRGKDDGDDA